MHWFSPILYPFSVLYSMATKWRNHLFDQGIKRSTNFTIPTVVVGNLAVGGTGKTPTVEMLIRELSEMTPGIISRGYQRKTAGFVMATPSVDPMEIGDEPYQIYSKFGDRIALAVGESRAEAIPLLLAERPDVDIIILDDAFQHRYVRGDFNILLTTYQRPFFDDHVLPLGRLREGREGARRADLVIVTKCPEIMNENQKDIMAQAIGNYTRPSVPVLFSWIRYGTPVSLLQNTGNMGKDVIVMCGIAHSETFISAVKDRFNLLEIVDYPDHHKYNVGNLENLVRLVAKHRSKNPSVITTEKDAAKLKATEFLPFWREIPIFALPMEMDLADKDRKLLVEKIGRIVQDKNYRSE